MNVNNANTNKPINITEIRERDIIFCILVYFKAPKLIDINGTRESPTA